jgi:hypothetical protein
MSFTDVLHDVPFQPEKKKKKKVEPKKVVKVEQEVDSSDIKYITDAIKQILLELNGKNFEQEYIIKVTPGFKVSDNRKLCFRAKVVKKYDRKVLIDFFVERAGPTEYVFSPPLDLKAFTVNSYENRSSFSQAS